MKVVTMILSGLLFNTGCTTINVTAEGDVAIDAHKQIETLPEADVGINGI